MLGWMDNGKAREASAPAAGGVKSKLYSGGVGSAGGAARRRESLRSEEKDGEDASPLDTEPSVVQGRACRRRLLLVRV